MSLARDLVYQRDDVRFNPPRRRSSPAPNLPTDVKELRHKCSWCGRYAEHGELIQRRASLVCKQGCGV